MVSKIIAVRPAEGRDGQPSFLVGHVVHLGLRHVHEKLGRHVKRAAGPLEAYTALSGFALIHATSSATFFAGTDGCTARSSGTTCTHRLEVLDRVERHLLEEMLVGGVARGDDHQRVAVGQALGDEVGAEVVGSAGLVLDHHRLAERSGELLGERASNEVDGTARCRRHHDTDRSRRPGLRGGVDGGRGGS